MEIVPTPQGTKLTKLMELFVVKFDNIQQKYISKVRFVARGDLEASSRKHYSPVASQLALRLFLITSIQAGYQPIQQLDVSNAFIYGRLDDYKYIQLPAGHPSKHNQDFCWRTRCSIYGLQESPSIWNSTIDSYLQSLHFTPLISELCLYYLPFEGGYSTTNQGGQPTRVSKQPLTSPNITARNPKIRTKPTRASGNKQLLLSSNKHEDSTINKDLRKRPWAMLLLLYVDDILFTGQPKYLQGFKQKWKLSTELRRRTSLKTS